MNQSNLMEFEKEAEMEPKYPNIIVELVVNDGNAFAILGVVGRSLRKGGVNEDERNQFMVEAKSGDYDHFLQTCMAWVTVE